MVTLSQGIPQQLRYLACTCRLTTPLGDFLSNKGFSRIAFPKLNLGSPHMCPSCYELTLA